MDAGAIFHAASSLLEKLDDAQNRFLRTIDIIPEHAFLEYNFAPLKPRCIIAILGMLHKRVLDKYHFFLFFTHAPLTHRSIQTM